MVDKGAQNKMVGPIGVHACICGRMWLGGEDTCGGCGGTLDAPVACGDRDGAMTHNDEAALCPRCGRPARSAEDHSTCIPWVQGQQKSRGESGSEKRTLACGLHRTAIHEAGHVVASYWAKIESVRICAEYTITGDDIEFKLVGMCVIAHPDNDDIALRFGAGGCIAEMIEMGDYLWRNQDNITTDYTEARDMFIDEPYDEMTRERIEWTLATEVERFQRPRVWRKVLAIAAALEAAFWADTEEHPHATRCTGTLTGDEVERILDALAYKEMD